MCPRGCPSWRRVRTGEAGRHSLCDPGEAIRVAQGRGSRGCAPRAAPPTRIGGAAEHACARIGRRGCGDARIAAATTTTAGGRGAPTAARIQRTGAGRSGRKPERLWIATRDYKESPSR